MRKIKFRGKTLDGRWIYGDLWHRPYAKDCVTIVSFMEDTGTTGGLEVIPETVGQYTGLKDKNGKEIYEGDICRAAVYKDPITLRKSTMINSLVGFRKGAFTLDGLKRLPSGFRTLPSLHGCEVIGNIHDNPELIQQQDQEEARHD